MNSSAWSRLRSYLQSTLKLSWNTVVVPLALIVKCSVSCTRKLFSGPWPIILKLFTNVSFAWPFWREFLKLDETIYQEILKTIHETGKVFERLPSTYAGKDEESLRDHLILQLEPRFEYSSTGETFNKSGKTAPEEQYLRRGMQVLGRSEETLRDNRSNSLVPHVARFKDRVDTKEMAAPLKAIEESTSQLPCFVKFNGKKHDSWFDYTFHLKADNGVLLRLSILCFHLPKQT